MDTGYDAEEADWPFSARDEEAQPIRWQGGADLAFVREWLAAPVTEADLHNLAGVPPGARLTVACVANGLLPVSAVGQTRLVGREGQPVVVRYQTLVRAPMSVRTGGTLAQVLQFCYCTSSPNRTGFGTDVIARMVAACERIGLERIEAVMAGDGHDGSDTASGYYVWPYHGFDALLLDWSDLVSRPLPEALRASGRISPRPVRVGRRPRMVVGERLHAPWPIPCGIGQQEQDAAWSCCRTARSEKRWRMTKRKEMLTGEGFAEDEAKELFLNMEPLPPMSTEERRAYLERLQRWSQERKAATASLLAEAPPADPQPVPVAEPPSILPGA